MHGDGDVKGVSLAYWEIARAFTICKSPFAAHVEYNGGFGQWKSGDAGGSYQINDAWLGGVEYIWNAEDFSKGLNLQVLYKYIRGKHNASFQLTAVWYVNFLKDRFRFAGFADFWMEDNTFADKQTKFVLLAEPQIWYNLTKHFAIGSEIEIGSSSGGVKGLRVNPTIAAKWIL